MNHESHTVVLQLLIIYCHEPLKLFIPLAREKIAGLFPISLFTSSTYSLLLWAYMLSLIQIELICKNKKEKWLEKC